MCNNGWDDPVLVADLFQDSNVGFDKHAIGNFLCENNAFASKILVALLGRQNFAGQELDVALRQVFSILKLPRGAAQIDRVVERFADTYYQENSERFADPDSVYVLVFSLLMLHTDLYNPKITKKITKEQFVHNTRGSTIQQDWPRGYLEQLYDAVLTTPIPFAEDESSVSAVQNDAPVAVSKFWTFAWDLTTWIWNVTCRKVYGLFMQA